MITLFKKNSLGIGRWSIWAEGTTLIISHSLRVDSLPTIHKEIVDVGLQGRSIHEQLKSRIDSRVSKQLDKGYKYSLEDANKSSNNTLDLPQPMKALVYDPEKYEFNNSIYVQPKLNGHRCLITKREGVVIAYSRQGKLISTIEHICKAFENVPEGIVYDGEIYLHGSSLQVTASLVKRQQPKTKDLTYMVYDIMSGHNVSTFVDRFNWLTKNFTESEHVKLLETECLRDAYQHRIRSLFSKYISRGFEGCMIRRGDGLYEPGKRSKYLLKMKPLFDDEVIVTAIESGANDVAVCTCSWPRCAESFKVLAPGTLLEKQYVLSHQHEFLGRPLKIEFRELTDSGKPFHAVAIEWLSLI